MKKIFSTAVCGVLLLAFVACSTVLSVEAADLMAGLEPDGEAEFKTPDDRFINALADFSVKLFVNSLDDDDSTLVSPTSVITALAMATNGADGETLAEIETAFGMPIGELNGYLGAYIKDLPQGEGYSLKLANSIWMKNRGLKVERDFLQTNADYYAADAYSAPFDDSTVDDINKWVSYRTDGLIDEVIDEIEEYVVAYVINTLLFDAEWPVFYERRDIEDGTFTEYDGEIEDARFMCSKELYLKDENAQGFIKKYKGGRYAFVAMLPDVGVDVLDYANGMTAKRFISLQKPVDGFDAKACLPKFDFDYSVSLNDAMKSMGVKLAFDENKADFTRLGTSEQGNIYINNILHKTSISVGERGTKAGAVTVIESGAESAMPQIEVVIKLDRPFFFAIVDTMTSLPIFMGTTLSL